METVDPAVKVTVSWPPCASKNEKPVMLIWPSSFTLPPRVGSPIVGAVLSEPLLSVTTVVGCGASGCVVVGGGGVLVPVLPDG